MYWIQRKDELGEDKSARSNSLDEDGWSSGAVAVKSTARDLPLLFDLAFDDASGRSASSSESESLADAEPDGEGARPDQSKPPATASAGAGADAPLLLDV